MSPVLSIILPVYNGEAFLEQAIQSVCAQTLKNWELIVINDGSTDSSESIALRFCTRDTRIRCLKQQNLGLSAARNAGFRDARGIYIAYLDADDYVDADYYQNMVEYAKKHRTDFMMAGFVREFVHNDIKTHSSHVLFKEDILRSREQKQACCDRLFFYHAYIHVWNKLYRRDFLSDHEICFDEALRFGEDVPYNLQCLKYAPSIALIPMAGYHYVCNQGKRLTGEWNSLLWGENRHIYNQIHSFETSAWKLNTPWVSSGMYLRGCFLTAEKAIDSGISFRALRSEFAGFLKEKETARSIRILDRRCLSLEFSVYRIVIKSGRPFLFFLSVLIRRGMKRVLGH